jgi:hypothetical protein
VPYVTGKSYKSTALEQVSLFSKYTAISCGNGKITQCVMKNNKTIMTIYERGIYYIVYA